MAEPRKRRDNQGDRGGNASGDKSDLTEKVVFINRCAKVVKGGRRFSFSALIVAGDKNGRVGFGFGKANEVSEAIRKASESAKKSLIKVAVCENTSPHEVIGEHGGGRVLLRPASPGTGIIAGGPMRAIFEALGVQDIVAKSIGTSNPHNMIKATFAALTHVTSPRAVAARRGKKVAEILGRPQSEARENA